MQILHYLDIRTDYKEIEIMEKTLDLKPGTTLYTIDFKRERIIPIVVVNLTNKTITLKSNSDYNTFFNCEGIFSYAVFLKMFGTSLFVTAEDAAVFNERLTSIKEYGVKSACTYYDNNDKEAVKVKKNDKNKKEVNKRQLVKQAIAQSDMPGLASDEGFIDYILSNKEYTDVILSFI